MVKYRVRMESNKQLVRKLLRIQQCRVNYNGPEIDTSRVFSRVIVHL